MSAVAHRGVFEPDADIPPLLWSSTASLAFLAHLSLLYLGVSAYSAQIQAANETREIFLPSQTVVIATSLQLAGQPTPELQALSATTVEPSPLEPVATQTTTLSPVDARSPEGLEKAPVASAQQPASTTVPPVSVTPDTARRVDAEALTPPEDQPGVAPPIDPALTAETLTPAIDNTASPAIPPAQVSLADAASIEAAETSQTETALTVEHEQIVILDSPDDQAVTPVEDSEPDVVTGQSPSAASASLPSEPNDQPEREGIASPVDLPEQTPAEAQVTYATVIDFLRSFPVGDCFAALPVLAEDGTFRFETFARSQADLARFRAALETETGALPGTVMKPVSEPQCDALPFVTKAARYPEFQLYFDLDSREIESGTVLSGRLGNTSGGFISLLVIDDDGIVQDLTRFLQFRPGFAGFEIPMTLQGSPVETRQILMALSTKRRLQSLNRSSGQQAELFFQRLGFELTLQGGGEDVALVGFTLK